MKNMEDKKKKINKKDKKLKDTSKDIEKEVFAELDRKDAQIEDLKAQVLDLEGKLKSALSDYQNFKRRIENDKENASNLLENFLLREIINISDNIYLYIKHLEKDKKDESILTGIRMIYSDCENVIKSQGVVLEEVNVGDTFSPILHEVVGTVVGEDENKIVEVVRVGYKKGDQVIRPARVIVQKKEI